MSLHLLLAMPVCFGEKLETRTVELQIRTIAMDFWSVLEYQLLYKKNRVGTEKAESNKGTENLFRGNCSFR